jgi:preprotein translocase subunit YajC
VPELVQLLPLVGIALLFWLLVIRPASRRQRELGRMQSSLSVGDEVMLTSGVFGTLRELHDDRVSVEIAPGVVISVARGAIGNVVTPEPELGPAEPEEN